LKIKNSGDINSPFSISGVKDGKIINTQWYEPIADKEFVQFEKGDYDNYRIDAQLDIPEIKRKNNTLKTKGLFKSLEPIRLQWLSSLDNPDKTQLFFTPLIGWNNNDKLMAGLAFHNIKIPVSRKLDYVIAPMYSFGSKNLTGYFASHYRIFPESIFQEITIGLRASSFSYLNFDKLNSSEQQSLAYYKIVPKLSFLFKKKRARQFSQFHLDYELYSITEEHALFSSDVNEIGQYEISNKDFYVNSLTFGIQNKNPLNPLSVKTNLQQHKNFVKLNITANYYISYKKRNTGFDVRFFVGRFLYRSDENTNNRFNYNLSGGQASDYLYNEIFLGRNSTEGILNQQFAVSDGGFKNLVIPEFKGRFVSAYKWLNAVNLKSNLFTPYISLYGDLGMVGSESNNGNSNGVAHVSDVAYDLGISLNIFPEIFEIYFPFKTSSDLNQLNYGETIRFTLNLNTLNPIEKIKGIGF